MQDTVDSVVTENPTKTKVDFTSIDQNDIRVGVVMVALVSLVQSVTDNSFFSLIAMVAAAVFVFGQTEDARYYYMPYILWRNFLIKRRDGLVWPTKTFPNHNKDPGRIKAAVQPFFERFPIPIETEAITIDKLGEVAIAHNRSDNTSSIVLQVNGSIIPSLSLVGQHNTQEALAQVLRRLMTFVPGMKVKIAMVIRNGAESRWHLTGWYGKMGHPDVLNPPGDVDDADPNRKKRLLTLSNSAAEDIELVPKVGGNTTMTMVISVKRENRFFGSNSPKKEKASAKAIRKNKLLRIAEKAPNIVGAALGTKVSIMNLEDLHRYFRRAWDIKHIDSYYEWFYDQLMEGNDTATNTMLWPQEEIRSGEGWCSTDSSHHQVLRVTGRPMKQHPADFRALFSADVPHLSTAVILESVKGASEYFLMNWLLSITDAINSAIGKTRSGEKAVRRENERDKRQKELEHQQLVVKQSIFVMVSNTSREKTDQDFEELESRADGIGLTTRPVMHPSLQLSSVITSATGFTV
jgi:hypothetical protein